MKRLNLSFLTALGYISTGISVLIFLYIISSQLFHLIQLSENYFDQYLFDSSLLRFLLTIGFILALIGWIIALRQQRVQFISPQSLRLDENVSLFLTSLLLAFFYRPLFSALAILQYPIIILIFFIFFLLIPQIIYSYTQIKLKDLKYIVTLLMKSAHNFGSH